MLLCLESSRILISRRDKTSAAAFSASFLGGIQVLLHIFQGVKVSAKQNLKGLL
jgi:hypothetical protein